MKDYLCQNSNTRFVFPIDGDCIDVRDGSVNDSGVEITATVAAAPSSLVKLCGVPMVEQNGIYTAKVNVKAGGTELTAVNETDGTSAKITVYHLPHAEGKYRISVDDNILFLCDITVNKDKYNSIFDNPYLAVYKKAHDLYGAVVHLNLFYAFNGESAACFSSPRPNFDLSMVTDKFKDEWRANSDWLKLSFHALKEFPDMPYRDAAPETITEDYLRVKREILRFAGEEAFSDVTTIHWGEANIPCVKALKALGIKALTGYFELMDNGDPLVSYYAPVPLVLHVGERDFWRDNELGVTFGRIDRVINIGTLDDIMADLNNIVAHPHRSGFVSLMIHEQYFYPDYDAYLPDFSDRVLNTAKFLFERGYKGAFVGDVVKESL